MRQPLLFATSVLIAMGWSWNAGAQQAAPDRSTRSSPTTVRQTTHHTAKPRKTRSTATTRADTTKHAVRPAPARAVTTAPQNPLPHVTDKDRPVIAQPTLGRIPFETGSIGFSTSKQYSTSVFPDGRVTPGFENVQTKDPSYFGFSLSVPTDKQNIIPLPFLSRP